MNGLYFVEINVLILFITKYMVSCFVFYDEKKKRNHVLPNLVINKPSI